MPDASIVPAPGRGWGWFYAWAFVGALYCLSVLGAMTIGVFVLPFAVVLTVVIANRPGARAGRYGLVSGAALPFAYVALLNRDGPGNICRTFENATSSGESCTQEWSPWGFALAALFLAAAGVFLFTRSASRTGGGD